MGALLVGTAGERWLTAAADVGLPADRVAVPWLPAHRAVLVRPDGIAAMRTTTPAPDPARFRTEVLVPGVGQAGLGAEYLAAHQEPYDELTGRQAQT